MSDIFLNTINRSISACYLVGAILIARLLLRKGPKWASVALWGLVALRLLCPFSLESVLSLIPSAQTIQPEIVMDASPEITSGIQAVDEAVNPVIQESFTPDVGASANPLQIVVPILVAVWCLGMLAMAMLCLISYLRLHKGVAEAVRLRGNLYQCSGINSPFVLGLIRPKIYLPYSLENPEREYVIAHERAHIRRKDHWWKAAGYLLLTVHWFNPLLWLAYILLCRDIELACDERVIRSLGAECRADYSQALLNCSISRRHIAACPLAFGEVGVKQRVKSALSYKKPTLWAILAAVLAIVLLAAGFLTDPVSSSSAIAKIIYQDGYQITEVRNNFSSSWRISKDTLANATQEGDSYEFEDRTEVLGHEDGCTIYLKSLTITDEDTVAVYQIVYDEDLPDYGKVVFPYDIYLSGQEISYFYNRDTGESIPYTDSAIKTALKTDGTLEVTTTLRTQGNSGSEHGAVAAVDMDELEAGNLIALPSLYLSTVSYTSTENPMELGGQSYTFQELLYAAPQYDSVVSVGTGETWCKISKSGELKMRTLFSDSTILDDYGTLSEFTLTKENFDDAFQDFDGAAIRQNTVKAWQKSVFSKGTDYSRAFVYFLLQENGDVYLAYGYYDVEVETVDNVESIVSADQIVRFLVRLGDPEVEPETTSKAVEAEDMTAYQSTIPDLNGEGSSYTVETYALTLEEIPADYTLEEAEADRCVTLDGGQVVGNMDVWLSFVQQTSDAGAANVRLYISSTSGTRICDLSYDGEIYTLRWLEDGAVQEKTYQRLTAISYGADDIEESIADTYSYRLTYFLTNGNVNGSGSGLVNPNNWTDGQAEIVSYYQTVLTAFVLPDAPTGARLEKDGETLLEITDADILEKLCAVLSGAENLGSYEPESFSYAVDLILVYEDSSTRIQLSDGTDLFFDESTNSYYDYGPGTNKNGSINALSVLLEILGLTMLPT